MGLFKKKEGGSKIGNLIRTVGPTIGASLGIPPGITGAVLGKPGSQHASTGSVGASVGSATPVATPDTKEKGGAFGTMGFLFLSMVHVNPFVLGGLALYLLPTWIKTVKGFFTK